MNTRPRPARRHPPVTLVALSVLLVAFLLVPTAVLLASGTGPDFPRAVTSPVVLDALRVSLGTTLTSLTLIVLLGTPVAYLLARYDFPGRNLLDTLLDLPIVLPPVIAGVGLLLTFGRHGLLGAPLELAGVQLAFTPAAVVLAQVFTSAPFFIRAAKAGFHSVNRDVEAAALTDGASRLGVFRHVTWPLAFPFLLEGLVLTWARALGEFGATILFAGSLQGSTRTITLAVYAALESDLKPALALSAVMVLVAFTLLFVVRAFGTRPDTQGGA